MSQAGSGQVLTLGDCRFDRSRGLLLRNDEPVPLRPKAFALLDHLAANCGRVVGKSDLIAAVWPGVFVTEDSLTQAVRELRKALADDGQRTAHNCPAWLPARPVRCSHEGSGRAAGGGDPALHQRGRCFQ